MGTPSIGFELDADAELGRTYLDAGYVIVPVEDEAALESLRGAVVDIAARRLGVNAVDDAETFLNTIHRWLGPDDLNDLRLAVIGGLADLAWVRPAYFSLAREALQCLVGNELVMQRRLNLSIQLPDDDGSLLPLHADVWSGDSPFKVVLWLPLVNCYGTKAMFFLPPDANARAQADLARFKNGTVEDLYREVEPDLEWLEVRYGQALLFTQNMMHGNRVNREPETRWSMNCRFKSLFSPYASKRLGEFFEPIVIRPATRAGMAYSLPGGFDE